MTTYTPQLPPPDPAPPDPDAYEPDEQWKAQLRARIEQSLASLVKQARDVQVQELRKQAISPEDRKKLDKEYKVKMDGIKQLGNDQYQHELQKERNQRRWSAGEVVDAESIEVLVKEQEQIFNSIKQKNTRSTLANNTLSSSPISEHLSSKPPSPFPRPHTPEATPARAPETSLSSPQRRQRRRETEPEPPSVDKPPSRRGSERRPNGLSGEHTEDPPPRRTNGQAKAPTFDIPASSWIVPDDLFEDPIDDLLPPRNKLSDKVHDRTWESSLSRSSGSSVRSLSLSDRGHPPSSKTSEEPASATAKAFQHQVHRRGSAASMRSTGSGASIRPMAETIPERGDDGGEDDWPDEGDQGRRLFREKELFEKREKEKRPVRRDSRAAAGDAPIRHDGPSSSMTMHPEGRYYQDQQQQRPPMPAAAYTDYLEQAYAPRELPRLPPRSPYNGDEREYQPPPATRPVPPRGPYTVDSPREREYPSARDLLASRPAPSRNGYSGDDRDYPTPPPSTVRSPPPPRVPYDDGYGPPNGAYGPSPPPRLNGYAQPPPPPPSALHSPPFAPYEERSRWDAQRDPHWDEQREAYARDRERERADWEKRERDRERDREREREREREEREREEREREREQREREQREREQREREQRERERDYSWGLSHGSYHPYAAQPSRPPSYPSPPPSANLGRHDSIAYASHPATGPPSRTYSAPYRETSSVPPQEYDYPAGRSEIARQASYPTRRESDRRMDNNGVPDAYTQPPYAAYARPSPSSEEIAEQPPLPAWRAWRRDDTKLPGPPTNGASPTSPGYPRAQPAAAPPSARARRPMKPKRRAYSPHPPSPSEFGEGPYARTDTDSGSDDDEEEEEEEEGEEEEEEEEDEYDFDETDLFSGPRARVEVELTSSDEADAGSAGARRMVDESDGELRRKDRSARKKLHAQARTLQRLNEQERKIEAETRRKEAEVRVKEAEVRAREVEAVRRRAAEAEAAAALEKVIAARVKQEAVEKRAAEQRQAEEARALAEALERKEAAAAHVAQEAHRIEEEAARRAEEARRKEEEAQKKEAEAQKKEKEVQKREQDAKKRAAEAMRLEEEAKRKELELKRKEEAARKREEKLRQESEKTKQMQQEAQMIAELAKEKQEKLNQLEEETMKREREIRERENALFLREQEVRRREEEARRKEDDAKRIEEEAQEKEAEAKRKEIEAQTQKAEQEKHDEEARQRQQAQRLEDARKRRETAKREEARKREETQRAQAEREEQERAAIQRQHEGVAPQVFPTQDIESRVLEEERQREEIRQAREKRMRDLEEEMRNTETVRRLQDEDYDVNVDEDLLNNPNFVEEQQFIWRQLQYQQQADSIQRKRQEERSRHDSLGEPPWSFAPSSSPGSTPGMSRPPQPSQPSPQPQSAGPSTSERSSNPPSWGPTGSPWSSHTKRSPAAPTPTHSTTPSRTPNGTHPSPAPPAPNAQPPKPPTTSTQGPARASSFSTGPFPSSSPQPGPEDRFDNWQRRQSDFVNDQQERFRREQQKIEAEVQMRSAGVLTREDVVKVFERHERLWGQLAEKANLTWSDFPWPMTKAPATPDDISSAFIAAYLQSPCWPEKERHRTTKDRIKDHMKKWHPDRFDTKLLPKVTASEKEKVRLGAGNVARYLSDLLGKENDNNNSILS